MAVVSSLDGKCLPVLLASLRCYAPNWKLVVATSAPMHHKDSDVPDVRLYHQGRNFGEAFQYAVTEAVKFFPEEERIVILNDDCVLRPDTASLLETDFDFVESKGHKIGLMVTRSDTVCGPQNVRFAHDGNYCLNGTRLFGEHQIVAINVPVPICGMFRKEVWEAHPIPPIGWMCENVWSWDMKLAGCLHVMSSAYVHHVGGETVPGKDKVLNMEESKAWIRENRPAFFEEMAK